MTNANLAALAASGVSIWLDDLNRDLIDSGTLDEYTKDLAIVGVTTNPAIFKAAIADGDAYSGAVSEAVSSADGAQGDEFVDHVVRELTTEDVRRACDVLRPIYDNSRGVDGRVSLEVDPRLAHDTEATVAQALELAASVDRPNVMIKIPATLEGLPAISRVLAEGVDVNVTLIFSPDRYRKVAQAYISGLAAAHANGHNISAIHSVASVFVSRLDTEVDSRLSEDSELRGLAGLAGARLCHAEFQDITRTADWKELASAGAQPQRLLWASTGVKNPDYLDTMYVTGLVTHGTVNTLPMDTITAFAEHGEVTGDTVRGFEEESRSVFARLADEGIDLEEVFALLETQGVDKFIKAWNDLYDAVRAQV